MVVEVPHRRLTIGQHKNRREILFSTYRRETLFFQSFGPFSIFSFVSPAGGRFSFYFYFYIGKLVKRHGELG